jgi:hypothetical protein
MLFVRGSEPVTGQISDALRYKGDTYSIIGFSNPLFDPAKYGFTPVMMHTACYQGYHCGFVIDGERLFLENLNVNDKNNRYPEINGVHSVEHEPDEIFCWRYEGLKEQINFTGQVRLGKDFIQDLYVHMGVQSATSFNSVLEIEFKDGKVHSVVDRSKYFDSKRGEFKEKYEQGSSVELIEEAFLTSMEKDVGMED